jgi:hypothetical protein
MFQHVWIADSVLVGNFMKIHFQAFPSSLYTASVACLRGPMGYSSLYLNRPTHLQYSIRHPRAGLGNFSVNISARTLVHP